MKCNHCGQRLADGVKICPICNGEVDQNQQEEQIISPAPEIKNAEADKETQHQTRMERDYRGSSSVEELRVHIISMTARDIIKRMYKSVFTLAAAVLGFLGFLFRVIGAFTFSGEDYMAQVMMSLEKADSSVYEVYMESLETLSESLANIAPGLSVESYMTGLLRAYTILGALPVLLIAIAAIICYTTAEREKPSNAGLIILRVWNILAIVGWGFLIVSVLLILLSSGLMAADATIASVMIGMAFGMTIVLAVPVIYYVFANLTIKTIMMSVNQNVHSDKIYGVVAAFLFLSAFTMLGSGYNTYCIIGNLMGCAVKFIIGVFLINYRRAMQLCILESKR